jgi:hypothetical protein
VNRALEHSLDLTGVHTNTACNDSHTQPGDAKAQHTLTWNARSIGSETRQLPWTEIQRRMEVNQSRSEETQGHSGLADQHQLKTNQRDSGPYHAVSHRGIIQHGVLDNLKGKRFGRARWPHDDERHLQLDASHDGKHILLHTTSRKGGCKQ